MSAESVLLFEKYKSLHLFPVKRQLPGRGEKGVCGMKPTPDDRHV